MSAKIDIESPLRSRMSHKSSVRLLTGFWKVKSVCLLMPSPCVLLLGKAFFPNLKMMLDILWVSANDVECLGIATRTLTNAVIMNMCVLPVPAHSSAGMVWQNASRTEETIYLSEYCESH